MRGVQRRLHKLEVLPQFQPPPSPIEEIRRLALRHLSDEELAIMIHMTRDLDAGVRKTISETESIVVALQNAARETEARRAGFRSFAEAERKEGRRR